MAQIMIELAQNMGFDFQATTFPELFYFMFMAIAGCCFLAAIMRVLMYICFNANRMLR